MSNIQNQKSGLAKLMATENLIVQHAKVPTAMFDPKNRVLTCPIWEQMSGDLYDSFHIACAEYARIDVLLTTDDRLLRKP